MKSSANSPKEYIEQLPVERKEVFEKLREIIIKNIPKGFEEEMCYGMIGFVVPKKTYPKGYHCNSSLPLPFINIASQKNFISLYHMGIYANKSIFDWFVKEYPKHCQTKLDIGKSCIRFKKNEQIPFKLIAELVKKITVKEWIETYESTFTK